MVHAETRAMAWGLRVYHVTLDRSKSRQAWLFRRSADLAVHVAELGTTLSSTLLPAPEGGELLSDFTRFVQSVQLIPTKRPQRRL